MVIREINQFIIRSLSIDFKLILLIMPQVDAEVSVRKGNTSYLHLAYNGFEYELEK